MFTRIFSPVILSSWLLLAAILPGLAPGQDAPDNTPAPPESMAIIMTFDTGPAFSTFEQDQIEEAPGFLADAIAAAREDHPDALLIDLGEFTTPWSAQETAYSATVSQFFAEQGYDAVAMTAHDFARFGLAGRGAYNRPPEQLDLYLSAWNQKQIEKGDPLPARKVAGNEETGRIEIGVVSDPEHLVGFSSLADVALVEPAAQLLESFEAGSAVPSLLISDFAPAMGSTLGPSVEGLDLLVHAQTGPATAVAIEDAHYEVYAPEAHELQIVTIDFDPNTGAPTAVNVERTTWIDADVLAGMAQPALPVIGVSVPGQGRLARRFDIENEAIRLDVHRDRDLSGLTSRQNVYVYFVELDGVTYPTYRVRHMLGIEWVALDVLVMLDPETRTISRLETNIPLFYTVNLPTRFSEVLDRIRNQPPEDWDIPMELVAGYEQQAEEALDALRATLEIDALLYPDDQPGAAVAEDE